MSDNKALQLLNTPFTTPAEHNVHGWERAGSLAAGVILLGKGVARGGIFGLVQIALGGVALKRGFTGHSEAKSMLQRGRESLDEARGSIERAGDELVQLKDKAVQATKEATVTGNDALDTPKV
ncbi:DUF2892 domain-containing protein [Pseudomonas sp. dw_358]|uniref:YgaP family membrane protein n=1 Tax=Pseudomonas sp. dw_358 TaxID=2720083 RepID=UPI001BD3A426|nr:DUF2892 domain-containing protein [Pseudomonas sp. dw_358]